MDNKANNWLGGDALAYKIWNTKYRHNEESFDEWLDRVSGNNPKVRELILNKKFIFGGRILSSRGVTDRKVTYSNCYVIAPPEDNLESIFECSKKLARTYSYGGGCGIDVSKLAPKGAKIHNAANSTSGAVSFMDFYSNVTGLIGQEGRRGALMISIICTHPDLIDFINLKTDLNICTKANISVRITDDFMKAVVEDRDWTMEYYRPESDETITNTMKAKDILYLLAQRNWEMAEPGILYWDRISKYNLLDNTDFEYAGVNPCAEEPLPAGGSCLLGSINLSEFVLDPFTKEARIDYDELERVVAVAIAALNKVLMEGLELHPLQEQRDSVSQWRQIGLGTMGLADMLIKLGIVYGSDRSLEVIKEVYSTIAKSAVLTSNTMAKEYGCYPACDEYMLTKSSFIKNLGLPESLIESIREYGLFNSQLLTCAPTGSIGTMLGTSTGVEPIFAKHYTRMTQSLDGKNVPYEVNTPIVQEYLDNYGDTLPEYFVESKDIDPSRRILVQSYLQEFTDASISSTINLPEEATVEDIYNIYVEAWKEGLKGVTVYRQNCNRQGVLTVDKPSEIMSVMAPKRPKVLEADCYSVKIQKDKFIVAVGILEGKPYEIFAFKIANYINVPDHKGSIVKVKKGQYSLKSEFFSIDNLVTEMEPEEQAVTLYSSMLLRHGVGVKYIMKTTKKVNNLISSFSSAVCRILSKYVDNSNADKCPKCGGNIINEGGCLHCDSCEYSKCE